MRQFTENIIRIRSLHATYTHFNTRVTDAVDLSDLLRAEIVLLVSAFDYFVHELVREGMIDAFSQKREMTDQFRRFEINIDSVDSILKNGNPDEILKNQISLKHSYKSFQTAEKVAEAIRLMSSKQLWIEVGNLIRKDPNDLKIQLNLIIDRRNKIAHEADIDPSIPGNRWPIDATLINNSVNFIEEIVNAINSVVA